MIVTLFCDASWCPETFVGGWGAWVKSDRVPVGHQYAGAFMTRCASSNEAEAMGVTNALHYAVRDQVAEAGDVILFQLDSVRALQVIGWKKPPPTASRNEAKVFYHLDGIRRAHRLQFRTRHVKGHAGPTAGTRGKVNQLCDRLAGEQMRGLRDRLADGRFTWPTVIEMAG